MKNNLLNRVPVDNVKKVNTKLCCSHKCFYNFNVASNYVISVGMRVNSTFVYMPKWRILLITMLENILFCVKRARKGMNFRLFSRI